MYGRQGTNRVFSKVRNSSGYQKGTGSLEVFKNPFSQAELQPVIPDGKAVTSAGQRLQNVTQIEFDQDAAITCMLFPGLGGGATWWGDKGSGFGYPSPNDSSVNTHLQSYTSHGGWKSQSKNTVVLSDTVDEYAVNFSQNTSSGTINAWRLVSQGIRISLVNNSDQNDGWWEAIRVAPSQDPGQYCFVNSPAGGWDDPTGAGTVKTPTDARICASVSCKDSTYSGQWVDNPSYITGKLRDIHKHVFCLHPVNTDHDFCHLKPQFELNATTLGDMKIASNLGGLNTEHDGQIGAGYGGWTIARPSAASTDLIQGNIDFSYDILLIRIHGRTTDGSETKILSHLISNQEVCYAEGTLLERFQRRTLKATGFRGLTESMRKNIRPSGVGLMQRRTRRVVRRRAPVRRRRMTMRRRPMKRRRLTRRRRY